MHKNLIKILRANFSLWKRNTNVNLNYQKTLIWNVTEGSRCSSYVLCQGSYGNVLALEIMFTV